MQVKPPDADRLLADPARAPRVILIHGNDDGLVAERVEAFTRAVTGGGDDPFAHVRLEPNVLADDPGRLADEAHAVPMFGGRRAITIRLSGNWSILAAVEPLLADPPVDSWIIIAAGELRKTAPIRKALEASRAAAVIACYADSAGELDRLIDDETRKANLSIGGEARAALRDQIGGDRLASRSEVAKLCLYADGAGEITVDDVRAAVGDVSAVAVDETVDAAASGDAAGFAERYRRLVAAGAADFTVAGAALRHFGYLHRARAQYDRGASADDAVGPQIFFKRKAIVARQIQAWPSGRIERVLGLIEQAIVDSRLRGAISAEIVGQAMMMIATLAPRPRRD